MTTLPFNTISSNTMHIDLNSCFATIEQQANPHLRGKPIVVAAYNSPGGCILAPSIEAKRYGIKTGMRVRDGKKLYPKLLILDSDPDKYRFVHKKLRDLISDYTNDFHPKSIDEFVLNFAEMSTCRSCPLKLIAQEIKDRIKSEIGEWLTVSIGIAPNRFLAKTGAGLNKPDGLDEINSSNFLDIYKRLKLTDLCGINVRNEIRLICAGIKTVTDMYNADTTALNRAFQSIGSYYWYLRLRGYEIDNFESDRKSFGNSYALPHSEGTLDELIPILYRLCEKTGFRMRQSGFKCRGIHVGLSFKNGRYWHHGTVLSKELFDSRDIFKEAVRIIRYAPIDSPIHTLSESCFYLTKNTFCQLEIFDDLGKKKSLIEAVDKVNIRWADTAVTYGSILKLKNTIRDRISFGGVREL